MLGLEQKQVAAALGPDWNQKKISRIEGSARVPFGVRQKIAMCFEVDVPLIDEFNAAAGRLALMQIIRLRKLCQSVATPEDAEMLEDITALLEGAFSAIHRERQNMQLILRFLQQIRFNKENRPAAGEVRVPYVRLGKLAC